MGFCYIGFYVSRPTVYLIFSCPLQLHRHYLRKVSINSQHIKHWHG